MRRLAVTYYVFLILALSTVTSQASIIVNGSFENPVLSSGTWNVYQSIPGWIKTTGTGIEVQNNAAGSAYAGSQLVELDSNSNSGMKQTILTTPGQMYDLSFAYSPRPNMPNTTNGIEVFWDGGSLGTVNGTGGANTVWTIFHFTVTATGSSTDLEFLATTLSDSYGGYLDAVSLEAVPEPATIIIWSLLGGFGLVYGWRRRKTA